MGKRAEYISIARAILIIMVVIGHTQTQLTFVLPRNWIAVFHMPAFFIISGILFDNDKWKSRSIRDFILRKIKTLLIPYVFFEFFGGIIEMVIYGPTHLNLNGIIYNAATMNCNIGADWFLPTLFAAELVFFLLTKFSNKYVQGIVTLIGTILIFYRPTNHYLIVLFRMVVAYVFVCAGNIFKQLFTAEYGKRNEIIFIIIAFLATVAATATNGLISIWSLKLGNPIIFLVAGFAGSYMIIRISRYIHCSKLSYIGDHSLTIMGTHQIISDVVFGYFGIELITPLTSLEAFAVIFLFELLIVPLFDTCVPFLIGKSKPNK